MFNIESGSQVIQKLSWVRRVEWERWAPLLVQSMDGTLLAEREGEWKTKLFSFYHILCCLLAHKSNESSQHRKCSQTHSVPQYFTKRADNFASTFCANSTFSFGNHQRKLSSCWIGHDISLTWSNSDSKIILYVMCVYCKINMGRFLSGWNYWDLYYCKVKCSA